MRRGAVSKKVKRRRLFYQTMESLRKHVSEVNNDGKETRKPETTKSS